MNVYTSDKEDKVKEIASDKIDTVSEGSNVFIGLTKLSSLSVILCKGFWARKGFI